MKKLRTFLSNWFDKLDERWRAMPVKKQHRYTLLLFSGYALLTIIVIAKVCYDVGSKPNKGMGIEHIENPVLRQQKSPVSPLDSISTILKRKMYER